MKPDLAQLRPLLNRAHKELGYAWPLSTGMDRFKEYLAVNAGIRVTLDHEVNGLGQFHYTIVDAAVTDEAKFSWWVLKWS